METIISFFKRRWWSFMPLAVCVCVEGAVLLLWGIQTDIHQGDVFNTLGILLLYSLPGTLFLLFVRKKVVESVSIFALLYIIIGIIFLMTQDASGGMWGGSDRGVYSVFLGIGLSVVTIIWATIHTLVIRHAEKKNKTV